METTIDAKIEAEQQEFESTRETLLWDQAPMKVSTFTHAEPQPSGPDPVDYIFAQLLGTSSSSGIENIRKIQADSRLFKGDLPCSYETLMRLINIKETECDLFKDDYKKWQRTVYTKDAGQTEQPARANVAGLIEEIKSSGKKKDEGDFLQRPSGSAEEKVMNINVGKSAEEKRQLEQWLDDIL